MTVNERIERRDLKGFSEDATKLLLWAQEQGGRVLVSNRGHAIVRGPDGRTACVARQLARDNRSSLNARANIRRLFRVEAS